MTGPWRRQPAGGRVGRGILAVTLAAVVGVLGACGIPASSGPRAIAKADVPFHLLNPSPPSTSTTISSPRVSEVIFLVDPSLHVTPVPRDIAVPANLSQILTALLYGPTATESAAGIQSFITGGGSRDSSTTNRVVASVNNGIATVDFATSPVQVIGSTQTLLAIAQVVYTATAQPGVSTVSFEIAGQPIEVPTAPDGALVATPVGTAQYKPQAPVAATP